MVDDVASLLSIINGDILELHTWQARSPLHSRRRAAIDSFGQETMSAPVDLVVDH